MTRTRAVGFLLLLCVAGLGWHLVHRAPAAAPSATATGFPQPSPSPSFATTSADDARTAASPTTATPTPLTVTPQPPDTTLVQADVPQDSSVGPRPTPGPHQGQVEAEEPPVDQLTDAQLQAALERQTADRERVRPDREHDAAAAAWQHLQPTLAAANTWTDIEQRAAVALLIGQHTDPTQPVPVNVITTWTGTDPEGVTGAHRAETKLLYTNHTWWPVN